jgi:hypothetical protein
VINQSFLTQIVLFERAGSRTAIQRGRALVDPNWLLVLLHTWHLFTEYNISGSAH